MTADPVPFDFHHLLAELAETASPAQVDRWLMGTVARRNALPVEPRHRLADLVAVHRATFERQAA